MILTLFNLILWACFLRVLFTLAIAQWTFSKFPADTAEVVRRLNREYERRSKEYDFYGRTFSRIHLRVIAGYFFDRSIIYDKAAYKQKVEEELDKLPDEKPQTKADIVSVPASFTEAAAEAAHNDDINPYKDRIIVLDDNQQKAA